MMMMPMTAMFFVSRGLTLVEQMVLLIEELLELGLDLLAFGGLEVRPFQLGVEGVDLLLDASQFAQPLFPRVPGRRLRAPWRLGRHALHAAMVVLRPRGHGHRGEAQRQGAESRSYLFNDLPP